MGHGFGCGDGSYIDGHQRHVCVFSALSSGCLVYGAFVTAVAMVLVVAWACLGCVQLFVLGFV